MKKNVDLATTYDVTSTYVGEHAQGYVAAALLSAATIESGAITVMPNIKYQETLTKLASSGLIKNATCDFDAQGTVTRTEKVITPKELQVNLQLCKKDFINQFEAASMGYSAHSTVPNNFAQYLIGHVLGKVAEQVEQNIWSGDSSNAGEMNGIETEIALDANLPAAQEGATTAVTVANVIGTCLQPTVNAIPNDVYGKEGLKLRCATNVVKAYIGALGGHLGSGVGAAGTNDMGTQFYTGGDLTFNGIQIVMCPGMSDNVVIATTDDNLIFGTGLLSDQNEIKLIDMAPIDGSQNFRFVARFTGVATYINPEDIVTYGINNSAN